MKYWLILASLLFLPCCAQDRAYNWSVVAVVGSQALDIHSSMGHYEANPVLGSGPFGKRQIGTKLAIVGGWQVAQWLIVRRWPETRRAATLVNYAAAGATGAVSVRNYRVGR